tara:strand:- start:2417 stop:2650 length:234 start_codon:yes stop_codon:yes gene_type:complete
MFKIMAFGLITFATMTSTNIAWDKTSEAPWTYQSPTKTSELSHAVHCYQWLPLEMKTIQKVSKKQEKEIIKKVFKNN